MLYESDKRLRTALVADIKTDPDFRRRCAPVLAAYFQQAVACAEDQTLYLDYDFFDHRSVSSVLYTVLQTKRTAESDAAIACSLQYYSKTVDKRPFVREPTPIERLTGVAKLDEAYAEYRCFIACNRIGY